MKDCPFNVVVDETFKITKIEFVYREIFDSLIEL